MSQQTLAHFVLERNIRHSPRRSPLRTLHTSLSGSDAVASPMSPDEEVIRQRGQIRTSPRKRAFQTSTPAITDIGLLDTSLDTSTTSSSGSRTPTRKSAADGVRKRLMLSTSYISSDPEDSPCPKGLTQSAAKKRKSNKGTNALPVSINKRLSALSSEQLTELLGNLINKHPDLKEEVEKSLPKPDIGHLMDNLEYFRKNIFKSLPNSRWGSSRDAFCFRRVKTHVENFKSTCISQGKQLQDAGSWEASLEYILQAWECVGNTPDWDNVAHNKSKEMCFRNLATQCKKSVKESSLDKDAYIAIKDRLEEAVIINNQISPCIEIVDKKIQKIK